MGLFACILFGIIASWISISVYPRIKPTKGWFVMFTGLVGGITGAYLGRHFNFADFDMFNMYSVGMSMATGVVLTAILSLTRRNNTDPATQAELVYEEDILP